MKLSNFSNIPSSETKFLTYTKLITFFLASDAAFFSLAAKISFVNFIHIIHFITKKHLRKGVLKFKFACGKIADKITNNCLVSPAMMGLVASFFYAILSLRNGGIFAILRKFCQIFYIFILILLESFLKILKCTIGSKYLLWGCIYIQQCNTSILDDLLTQIELLTTIF